ncbi:M56 family metallopeptidase, partial [Rubricoccus marinus]
MSSALTDLGTVALEAFWVPVFAWTVLALLVEVTLRALQPSARLGLATRGSLVALLPLSIVGPPLLARWVPSILPAEPVAPLASASREAIPDVLASVPSFSPEVMPAPATDWTALAVGSATLSAIVAGALALLILAGGLVWIARYRQRLQAATRPVRDEAEGLSRRMGVTRQVRVAVVDDAISPFTVGLWRPLVALPQDLDADARRLALAHEFAHVRDAHFGWAVGERLVRAAFVWHPLVHVLGRGLALDREREADAAVLRLWPERAAEYGQLLHALASRPSPRFCLGASSSPLLTRLHAMTRSTPERRRLARLVGAMLLVLPLLASAAVLPDAPLQAFTSQLQSPTPPSAPEAAPLAPEAAPEAPEAPEEPEVLPPPPPRATASADTLMRYMRQRQVWSRDGEMRIELELTSDAT